MPLEFQTYRTFRRVTDEELRRLQDRGHMRLVRDRMICDQTNEIRRNLGREVSLESYDFQIVRQDMHTPPAMHDLVLEGRYSYGEGPPVGEIACYRHEDGTLRPVYDTPTIPSWTPFVQGEDGLYRPYDPLLRQRAYDDPLGAYDDPEYDNLVGYDGPVVLNEQAWGTIRHRLQAAGMFMGVTQRLGPVVQIQNLEGEPQSSAPPLPRVQLYDQTEEDED